MAARTPAPPSTVDDTNLNINAPPPASYSGTNLNAPFTPRSTTFPEDIDSDPDFDGFDPTPIHSPSGPNYDDLPPTYDEAQQQALQDARAGIPPIDPENLEVHRMVLSDTRPPPHPLGEQQSRSGSSLLLDPNAYEFEPQNRPNANGLGVTVSVQQVASSEMIPVAHVNVRSTPSSVSNSAPPEPTSVILNRALAFTLHEPAADARYAPRLVRLVAIPQTSAPLPSRQEPSGRGRHDRCGGRRDRHRRHHGHHVPGQWPESNASSSTLHSDASSTLVQPVGFLRAYAKVLHAHDIRPAEFTEFLDGLNSLCLATTTTSPDLVRNENNASSAGNSSIVQNYINATNEAFFAPRGLKVSLRSLSYLTDTLNIPEERGQRSGAIASAIDVKSSPDQRAQALYPWVEPLETNVPAPSTQTLITQEMSERLHQQAHPETRSASIEENSPQYTNLEKPQAASHDMDPPHSVPEATTAQTNNVGTFPPFPTFPPIPTQNVPGAWGSWAPQNGSGVGQRGRGWGPGHSPWFPPGQRGGPWSRGSGPQCGAYGGGPGGMGHANNWAAWGESVGKWGEAFGKRMEIWGENFGKRAEQWGQSVEKQGEQMGQRAERWGEDFGRRAETWGQNVEARFSGCPAPNNQARGQPGMQSSTNVTGSSAAAAERGPEGLAGQQTGIMSGSPHIETKGEKKTKKLEKKAAQSSNANTAEDDDDDDDASSISSTSSSDSDSDDEDPESYPDTSALFLARIQSINATAAASRSKGKKSPTEIDRERDLAIEKASAQKTALDLKIEEKRNKRAFKQAWRERRREFKRTHKHSRREWKKERRAKKQDGASKKEIRELKRRQMEEYRGWKKEYVAMREEARGEWKARGKGKNKDSEGGLERKGDEMVWVVVENLGA